MASTFRIGTRNSKLARCQTDYVISLLKAADPGLSITIVPISTKGDDVQNIPLDKIGSVGLFTKEIERALTDNEIDAAVHSLKDLESELPDGLMLGAVPIREDARDALISKEFESLEELPVGAHVMTGSLRRKAQLLNIRNDIHIDSIRGNVETRIKKFYNTGPETAGLIMAAAGMIRLGLTDKIASYIPEEVLLPAVGQGALAVEIRKVDKKAVKLCKKIDNRTLHSIANAERSYLRAMQGGCLIPIGAIGKIDGDNLDLTGMIANTDGTMVVKKTVRGDLSEAEDTGIRLAKAVLNDGGKTIMDSFLTE